YCYHKGCLRTFILKYFGDRKQSPACQSCSTCAPTAARYLEEDRAEARPAGTLRVGRAKQPKAGKPTALEHFIIEQAPSGIELREQLKARAASRRALTQAESSSVTPPTRAHKLNVA